MAERVHPARESPPFEHKDAQITARGVPQPLLSPGRARAAQTAASCQLPIAERREGTGPRPPGGDCHCPTPARAVPGREITGEQLVPSSTTSYPGLTPEQYQPRVFSRRLFPALSSLGADRGPDRAAQGRPPGDTRGPSTHLPHAREIRSSCINTTWRPSEKPPALLQKISQLKQ